MLPISLPTNTHRLSGTLKENPDILKTEFCRFGFHSMNLINRSQRASTGHLFVSKSPELLLLFSVEYKPLSITHHVPCMQVLIKKNYQL